MTVVEKTSLAGGEGNLDARLGLGGETDFRVLRFLVQARQQRSIDVDLQLGGEAAGEFVGQRGVDVVATEPRVAVGGEDLKNALVEFEDRNVEGAAAEIVDGDF